MAAPDPAVTIHLPSVLEPVAGWRRREVRGRTIGSALEAAFESTPALRHHLLPSSGADALRPHILCVLNDTVIRREEALATTLREGDAITIHQAISGG